ncbi:jasmonate-induced oxygenase 4-like isoform X2 [Triticum urartu]|uniref:jasmonate-induced oxygenase 4-like isoform X2 n=1 Tax=Triticum urartu TaxID=4572 RepID=UPI0020432708|nr:jasmonate-induced oxygenase 4-like isoform X2 [Triticum urartu]
MAAAGEPAGAQDRRHLSQLLNQRTRKNISVCFTELLVGCVAIVAVGSRCAYVLHVKREATEKYACQLISLCQVLLKAMSSSLGLEEDYLHNAFGGSDGISATMRVNYYPRCPQPELTLGLSSHSDPGGITLLLTDDNVEGTQVRKGDTWVTVQPVPGSFLVNVGDQIQILSNGRYRSVEHRALVNSDKERFTIAFFCNPRGDLPVAPASELVGPGSPALYQEPVTFSDYRKYIRTKGPSGKTQVQSISSTMQPGPAA